MDEWEVASAQLAKTHGYSAKADYHKEEENARAAVELARDILRLARNTLFINLRFMEAAFVRLGSSDETLTTGMATDGQHLYCNSLHVCRSFKHSPAIPTRDLLHITLHCVFRHLFIGRNVKGQVWDLACDIAVEHIINELDLKCCYCERQEKQGWLIDKLNKELPRITAERVYRWLIDEELPSSEYERIRSYFYADDHATWYSAWEMDAGNGEDGNEEDEAQAGGTGTPDDGLGMGGDADDPSGFDDEGEDELSGTGARAQGESRDSGSGTGGVGGERGGEDRDEPALSPAELQQRWTDIAERIQLDLETVSSSFGNGAGDFVAALREVNREKYDYAAFLRRFSVVGENVEVNDDEFDYIFYNLGMELYGRMPLVEPLEYKDVKKVREFVIALDTSESVAGELVQEFVTKTWNILKQTDNFFSTVNVHILQCGARVEEDAKITTQDEFDEYMKHVQLRGFGGTDFRPVFEHVDALLQAHEFTNFKGLIYFTDGYGTYPVEAPSYDAAFVFLDQGLEPPEVPVWAIKMLITQDDIREL